MGNIPAHAHQIATSANGKQVYADLTTQPLGNVIGREPRLLGLIEEVISSYKLTTNDPKIEHDMKRQIGYSTLLKTTEKDVIFYARQLHSTTYTKFVKNRKRIPTQYITIGLRKDDAGDYELLTVCMGKSFPPAPGDEAETAQSRAYWEDHAVVYDGQSIIASTLAKTAPY